MFTTIYQCLYTFKLQDNCAEVMHWSVSNPYFILSIRWHGILLNIRSITVMALHLRNICIQLQLTYIFTLLVVQHQQQTEFFASQLRSSLDKQDIKMVILIQHKVLYHFQPITRTSCSAGSKGLFQHCFTLPFLDLSKSQFLFLTLLFVAKKHYGFLLKQCVPRTDHIQ